MRLFRVLGALAATALAAVGIAYAAPTIGTDVSSVLSNTPFFSSGFRTEQFGRWDKLVTDSTASTPAALGATVCYSGSQWLQSAVANAAVPPGTCGVVTQAAAQQGGQALIQVRGAVSALATTGTNAIAAGAQLVLDGSGNLTYPSPSSNPGGGAATPQGTTGAATVTYRIYARNQYGLDSNQSAAITTATANATLSPANSVLVTSNVPAGTTQVVVTRTVGGATQGVIAIVPVAPSASTAGFQFLNVGYGAGAATYTPNQTAPVYPPGTVLAIAQGALAASSTATAIAVVLAGY